MRLEPPVAHSAPPVIASGAKQSPATGRLTVSSCLLSLGWPQRPEGAMRREDGGYCLYDIIEEAIKEEKELELEAD